MSALMTFDVLVTSDFRTGSTGTIMTYLKATPAAQECIFNQPITMPKGGF